MTLLCRIVPATFAFGFLTFNLALSAQNFSRQIPSGGTGYFTSTGTGSVNGNPEIDPALAAVPDHDSGNDTTGHVPFTRLINRPLHQTIRAGNVHASALSSQAKPMPTPSLNFDGLDFYQQRYADNGNQFSVEPPDQGLCAGNGYVLETVNDVLRVFKSDGTPLTGPVSLNDFYGYIPAVNRAAGVYGPSITDPSCYFDPSVQRWFHLVLTLDRVGTTSTLSGTNHLDLAVSRTANPLGLWTIYRIPVQDDGTQGTPNHNCAGGPCLGDYPKVGTDANGVYLTSNEFAFFGPGFIGAQIYAISKFALITSAPSITVFEYNTADPSTNSASGLPGFSVWPALSAGPFPSEFGGTEYFLSSLAVFQDSAVDDRLQLWSLTNTFNLWFNQPPTLVNSIVNTEPYAVPGFARQPGSFTDGVGQAPGGGNVNWPLGQCLNIKSCAALIGYSNPYTEVIAPLAANDSRIQQIYYSNGKLWTSLGTGLAFDDGSVSMGLAYFILHPRAGGGTPTATVDLQGYLGDPNLDMTYGSVAATQNGRGIISFTATGPSNYPSVAFTTLDDKTGTGAVQITAPGVGANDGFTGYFIGGFDPRWGDYGAAVPDGNSIWFAQEYIGQTCTLTQYLASTPLGTCGATRAALGNWDTRIARVTP
ncbi:MAG TPA: hypothetical protein VGU25_03550 [Acidobacteriaceae bacterium]|nr:hypothetical protein [Acidobacteriaceae bacterium]